MSAGINVNHKDVLGWTAYLYAANRKPLNLQVLERLATAGADATAKNRLGMNALQLAIPKEPLTREQEQKDFVEFLSYLHSQGVQINAEMAGAR